MILPRGAVGELALGGPQLARGYLGQPDTTATKFVQHPVAGRVYLTGDFVRYVRIAIHLAYKLTTENEDFFTTELANLSVGMTTSSSSVASVLS